jgi:drug/metabolite transporter (DMT)-like permease
MIEQKSLSPGSWAQLGFLGLIWGGVFLSVRIALNEIPVLTAVLHRTGWAMLALWVVVLVRRLPVPRAPSIWGAFLVMGALNNAIPFALMAWGQLHIESGLTSILNATTAIFGVLDAAVLLPDERLTWRKGLGVGIGFAGVVVAIGARALARLDLRSAAQIAVLAGTLSYAFAGVWARNHLSGLSPVVAAAGMLTGSTLMLIPLTLWVDGVPSLDLAPITWIAIAYYAVIATAGASGCCSTACRGWARPMCPTSCGPRAIGSTTRSITASAPATWANTSSTTPRPRR